MLCHRVMPAKWHCWILRGLIWLDVVRHQIRSSFCLQICIQGKCLYSSPQPATQGENTNMGISFFCLSVFFFLARWSLSRCTLYRLLHVKPQRTKSFWRSIIVTAHCSVQCVSQDFFSFKTVLLLLPLIWMNYNIDLKKNSYKSFFTF